MNRGICVCWPHAFSLGGYLLWLCLALWWIGDQPVCGAIPLQLPQIEATVDASTRWKYCSGDDLTWANPELNDSDWKTVDLEKAWQHRNYRQFSGFVWYRQTFELPWPSSELERHSRPGISVGAIHYACYSVYVNGRLIGQFGELPPRVEYKPPQRVVFSIPDDALKAGSKFVVAIRMWRNPEYGPVATSFVDIRPPMLIIGFMSPLQFRVDSLTQQEELAELSKLVAAIVFFLVGLYHLQLFQRRPQQREYLWFGLLTLGATANIFFLSIWAGKFLTPLVAFSIGRAAIHLTFIPWIMFSWVMFEWKPNRWVQGYLWFQGVLAALTLLSPRLMGVEVGNWPVYTLIPLLYVWLYLIPREALRGNQEAQTICLGLLCLAAARIYQLLGVLELVPFQNLVHWGFGALIISMSVSLSNRFSRVHQELDLLNQELETKVNQRTAELAETLDRVQVSEQQALQAQQVALEANRAKSIFLANMSHELRTPLNAILGFVQLMRRRERIDPENRKTLDIISRSGEHLLALINDVLSISKIEAGQITLNEKSFDLARLLGEIEDIFRMRAEAKGIELVVEHQTLLPAYVFGDEGKLRQVLINLLNNALKFTEEGSVRLTVGWEQNRALIEVADTGFGIATEELPKLFEAFSQTESGLRAKEGTGLGLAISRNFIRLMHGEIEVSSELGKGTTFRCTLSLPKTETPAEAQLRPSLVVGLAADQPGYRILVVDDVAENRLLLSTLMNQVGFQVRDAANGQQAIHIWKDWHPNLIWMDIRMPVLGGVEATKEIRRLEASRQSEPTASRTVIIALTASAFEQDKEKILVAGCDDFITKPFQEATLFQKMTDHLGVQFLYEDEIISSSPDELSATFLEEQLQTLSDEYFNQLNQTLLEGHTEGALKVIHQFQPDHPHLAATLKKQIKAFQIDDILTALEKVQAQKR